MHHYIEKRVLEIAEFIITHRSTVRAAAKVFGVSKSTVHTDMTIRLPDIDLLIAEEVRQILDYNFSVRHLRGGESTHQKYINKKK